jgi:predicted nucleic acid-binding protein
LYGRTLHAPHLLDCEIASVGLKRRRRDLSSGAAIEAALQTYAQLSIERHAVDAAAVAGIASRYQLTAYDAAYLCVAEKLAAPLATPTWLSGQAYPSGQA